MLQSQKFTLIIKLQQLGLSNIEARALLQSFIDNNIKYEQVINKLEDIKDINNYFINNNERKTINNIICEMIKVNSSSKKAIQIDELLEDYNYNNYERGKLESSKIAFFNKSIDTIEKMLMFYKDFDLKKDMIMMPSRTIYTLPKLFARIMFLKEHRIYEYNKERIYSKRFTFEKNYGIKDEDLLKKYPLPNKYKIKRKIEYEYTKKQEMILKLMFCKMGLTTSESKDLIDKLKTKHLTYEQLIKSRDNIKEMIMYFRENNYKTTNINSIIASTTCKHSLKKVIKTDKILIKNDYSKGQREIIEARNSAIFNINEELLDKKITLIKDEGLSKELIKNSRTVVQSLNLTYARIRFIKNMGAHPFKYINILFREEDKFKDRFGVTTKDILEKFPIAEEKYKINQKRK